MLFHYQIQDAAYEAAESPAMLQMILYATLRGLNSLHYTGLTYFYTYDRLIILDCGGGCDLYLVSLCDRGEQGKVVLTSCFS